MPTILILVILLFLTALWKWILFHELPWRNVSVRAGLLLWPFGFQIRAEWADILEQVFILANFLWRETRTPWIRWDICSPSIWLRFPWRIRKHLKQTGTFLRSASLLGDYVHFEIIWNKFNIGISSYNVNNFKRRHEYLHILNTQFGEIICWGLPTSNSFIENNAIHCKEECKSHLIL